MPEGTSKLTAAMTGLALERQVNRALRLGKDVPCNRRRPENHSHWNAEGARAVNQSGVPPDDDIAARKYRQ